MGMYACVKLIIILIQQLRERLLGQCIGHVDVRRSPLKYNQEWHATTMHSKIFS